MALEVIRSRCWEDNWVFELDVKELFDNIDHELLMKAVNKHTSVDWEMLYNKRWFGCPLKGVDGVIKERVVDVPQGGVISAVLFNFFMHYAFDRWMNSEHL